MHRTRKLRVLVPLLVVSAVIAIASSFAVPDDGDEQLSAEEIAALERYADRFQRAQQLMGGGKDTEAAKIFRELLAERDDVAPVHHALAIVLRYQGKADEATRSFLRAAQLAPEDAIIARDAGLDLVERGFLADARPLLERSMKLDPMDLETGVGLGTALRRLGDRAAAVKAFQQAVKADSNSLDAHVGLAQSLVADDPERALAIVKPLNHNFADVCLVHGLGLEKKGDYAEARPLLLKAAQSATANSAGREVLLESSEGLVRCGDADGAVKAAEIWCKAESTPTQGPSVRASLTLATARAAQGDTDGALATLDAARPGGENVGIRMHTALFAAILLRRAGRDGDAQKLLEPMADAEVDLFEREAARRLLGRTDEAVFGAQSERPNRANDVAFIESEVARAKGDADALERWRAKARELSHPPGEYPGLLVCDPPKTGAPTPPADAPAPVPADEKPSDDE